MRSLRKYHRLVKRALRDRRVRFIMIALLAIGILGYAEYMQNRRLSVDSASYGPLLQLIARAESSDNYNAYFGHIGKPHVEFTRMSIGEVMEWQAEYVRQGSASSAVGRYQIIDRTLAGLVRQLGVDKKQIFDQAMQDKLAIALVERRGAEDYVNGELTREQFAANLAKEWAALPKVVGENPGDSYYASDGLNKSRVSVDEILGVVSLIKPR